MSEGGKELCQKAAEKFLPKIEKQDMTMLL